MPIYLHLFLPLIAETLNTTQATHVLRIGNLPWPESAPEPDILSPELARTSGTQRQRAELAIAAINSGSSPREASQLIAAMRDLLARQSLVFVPENLLDDTTLIGLGLTRQAHFDVDGENWQAWSYDIRTYKAVPDWLNPKFWANPENWNKYRW
jgi:hypothetical protein